MKAVLLLAITLALQGASLLAQSAKLYLAASETEALRAKEGQRVVVHGQVEGSKKSPSGTQFLHFKGAEFSLVTFKSDLGQFPEGEPVDCYEGKRLAVEGVLTLYQGKPQIKLSHPGQLTLLSPEQAFPPPQETPAAATSSAGERQERTSTEGAAAGPAPGRRPPVEASEYFCP